METERRREHEWLERLVGDWTYESEADTGPGEAPFTDEGTESVRSLGGVWVVCEGRGGTPGDGAQSTIMTLGFDPGKGRFVGTFVGSTMTHLWIYDGELDAAGKVLTLETEGPGYPDGGTMARYRDTIELHGTGERVHRSSVLGGDGRWTEFMTTTYLRAGQRA